MAGHTISIWSLKHVYSPWPTSKMKHCTVVLGSLGRNILHSVHSRQTYWPIILIGYICDSQDWCKQSVITCCVSAPLRGARTAPSTSRDMHPKSEVLTEVQLTLSLGRWFSASRRQSSGRRRLCWWPSTDSRTAASLSVTLLYLPLTYQSPSHCSQNVLMINFSTEKHFWTYIHSQGANTGLSHVTSTMTGYR